MEQNKEMKLAVLIDADNAQASVIKKLLEEVSTTGTSNIKRAYGDWTGTNLNSWKSMLLEHAIQPIQQFTYTTGKNSSDSALIIDAMDLLHEGKMDGFCIVSSDSDFTRLATRIREQGLMVFGFGEKKTPKAFVTACDKFTFVENFRPSKESVDKPKAQKSDNEIEKRLKAKLVAAIKATENDDGLSNLGEAGSWLLRSDPAFDSRTYGFDRLGKLVKSKSYIEVIETSTNKGNARSRKVIHMKLKD